MDYIDLGLPSGTVWSADFLSQGGKLQYLPYVKTTGMNLPTKEQWEELKSVCRWTSENTFADNQTKYYRAYCTGPNGNVIEFLLTGYIEDVNIQSGYTSRFWVANDGEAYDKNCVMMGRFGYNFSLEENMTKAFCGEKLPVRLVKQ